MAFSMGSTGSWRRQSGVGTMSEINVVPLVDVVLVLLIIFMLTAQVMEFGLEIDVPKVREERTSAQELPVVSMTAKGNLYLNDKPININNIGDEVRKRFGGQSKAVYVKADKNVTWDVLAQVVSAVSSAKLEVRMVTKPEDIADKPR
ncbi:MAG: biopolymer transporter ExbD [Acidobacteria bacterium]|nr:biopolymer transporter ExbD [Acidobacteriota bacterium]